VSLEQSRDKSRMTRPRRSDALNGIGTGEKPSKQRSASGQFEKGNNAATGWGWKRATLTLLPDTPEARRLYRAMVRELEHDTVGARVSCARSVRASVREAELDAAAVKVGVGTKDGRELLDLARQYGVEADRAYTAAMTWTKRKSPAKSAKQANAPSTVASMRAAIASGASS
jgi:hypothetical protein